MANTVLEDLGLVPGAVVLRAETGDLVDADELLRRAWDLDGWRRSTRRSSPPSAARTGSADEATFAALVELVHAWRRFPVVDPEIPPRLLPARWPLVPARPSSTLPRGLVAGRRAWYEDAEAGGD